MFALVTWFNQIVWLSW